MFPKKLLTILCILEEKGNCHVKIVKKISTGTEDNVEKNLHLQLSLQSPNPSNNLSPFPGSFRRRPRCRLLTTQPFSDVMVHRSYLFAAYFFFFTCLAISTITPTSITTTAKIHWSPWQVSFESWINLFFQRNRAWIASFCIHGHVEELHRLFERISTSFTTHYMRQQQLQEVLFDAFFLLISLYLTRNIKIYLFNIMNAARVN